MSNELDTLNLREKMRVPQIPFEHFKCWKLVKTESQRRKKNNKDGQAKKY